MADEVEKSELHSLLVSLAIDADAYFKKAEEALNEVVPEDKLFGPPERDYYWVGLPDDMQDEAGRLDGRLVSLIKQIARSARNATLVSEADQREIAKGAKAMRAALQLRRFDSWDIEVLHDEGTPLGVSPPGQSDDAPLAPEISRRSFAEWIKRVTSILDLVDESPTGEFGQSSQAMEPAKFRLGTAFIMMMMDPSKPELDDVSDAVKEVFEKFGIHAIRADDLEHQGLITERILSEIRRAEFCFADLSGSRPNVYYEVGYAHALSRRVILYRKAETGLHFDLAGYNCPEYKSIRDLKEKLTARLRSLTNKEPKS